MEHKSRYCTTKVIICIVLTMNCSLFGLTCSVQCINKVFITVANGDIETVTKVVGEYGLLYLNQVTGDIHVYEITDTVRAGLCLSQQALRTMKSKAPMIDHIYQSEEIIQSEKAVRTSRNEKIERRKRSHHVNGLLAKSPNYGMNIMDAWKLGYRGKGVVVGIVDTGIEDTHIDLKPNLDLDLSHNFVEGQNVSDVNPDTLLFYPEFDDLTDHGNLLAGLVAAVQDNDFCTSGVAPESKVAALKILGLYDPPAYKRALKFRIGALIMALAYKRFRIDIYVNSFGPGVEFSKSSSTINKVYRTGVNQGRYGKGSIYVVAAGNKGQNGNNANLDGYVSSIYSIAINSVGINGTIPHFAEPGASILASTYGEGINHFSDSIMSTSHRNSCKTGIKGTSESAAIASGIIALALQAKLTWRDVQHILVNTSNVTGLEGSEYIVHNSAGYKSHLYFGFGLLNASAIVTAARDWTNVPPQQQVTACSISNRLTTPYSLTLELCEDASQCVDFIEHVTAYTEYTSFYDQLTELRLCSPSATCSVLLTRRRTSMKVRAERVTRKWTFMSVQFWGEKPAGNWTLSMTINSQDITLAETERKSFLKCFDIVIYGYSYSYSREQSKMGKKSVDCMSFRKNRRQTPILLNTNEVTDVETGDEKTFRLAYLASIIILYALLLIGTYKFRNI